MLRKQTVLPAHIIKNFEQELRLWSKARQFAVELNDRVFTEIGYFID
jgi:hypothetical protein